MEKLSKICFVFAGIVSGLNDKSIGSRMADADGGEMPVYFIGRVGTPALLGGHFHRLKIRQAGSLFK